MSDSQFLCSLGFLAGGKVRHAKASARLVQDHLDALLKTHKTLANAPFSCIYLTYIYNTSTNLRPKLHPIDSRSNELPVDVVFGVQDMRKMSREEIIQAHYLAAIHSIVAAANRYAFSLPPFPAMPQGVQPNPFDEQSNGISTILEPSSKSASRDQSLFTWGVGHARSAHLFREVFLWDICDELAPFGNDAGGDALAHYETWRKERPMAGMLECVERLFRKWGMQLNDSLQLTEADRNREPLKADEWDNAMIAIGLAQLMYEGTMDKTIGTMAHQAIKSQLQAGPLSRWGRSRAERVRRLNVIRGICEVASSIQP